MENQTFVVEEDTIVIEADAITAYLILPETVDLDITPTTSEQNFENQQDNAFYDKVKVRAVTSDIDANIVAGNIKSGVTILGVEGS